MFVDLPLFCVIDVFVVLLLLCGIVCDPRVRLWTWLTSKKFHHGCIGECISSSRAADSCQDMIRHDGPAPVNIALAGSCIAACACILIR